LTVCSSAPHAKAAWSRGPQTRGCDPNLVRETFNSESRKNLNLHSKFVIRISQDKCNHLPFHVLRFIEFCARKLLLVIVVLNVISTYQYLPQNHMLTKGLCRENLELFLGSRQKIFVDPGMGGRIPHSRKQERKRQTPVRRRLSWTHAFLGRTIPRR